MKITTTAVVEHSKFLPFKVADKQRFDGRHNVILCYKKQLQMIESVLSQVWVL